MRGFLRAGLICLVLAIFFLPGVAAWSVTNVSIDPSGALTPGTHVLISLKINLSDRPTSHQPHAIRLVTGLEKQKWTHHYIAEGYDDRTMYSGKEHTLDEFPMEGLYAIRVTLEGTAPLIPPCSGTKNITILRIEELDEAGNVIEGSVVVYNKTEIDTSECVSALKAKRSDLATFRAHIDEKAVMGVNTTGAEAKYQEAKNAIDAASIQPKAQYSTELSYLTNATHAIYEGERLLDKAWAEKEVTDAQAPIADTDRVISWFMGNKSTASLPAVAPIITKREIAVSYIATANDAIAAGNYAQARVKAQEAYVTGNEAYSDAILFQRNASVCFLCDPVPPGPTALTIGVGIIVAGLLVTGTALWMRRKE